MKDPIRRDPSPWLDAIWWLVPVAFACAALAVVALSATEVPDAVTPQSTTSRTKEQAAAVAAKPVQAAQPGQALTENARAF